MNPPIHADARAMGASVHDYNLPPQFHTVFLVIPLYYEFGGNYAKVSTDISPPLDLLEAKGIPKPQDEQTTEQIWLLPC